MRHVRRVRIIIFLIEYLRLKRVSRDMGPPALGRSLKIDLETRRMQNEDFPSRIRGTSDDGRARAHALTHTLARDNEQHDGAPNYRRYNTQQYSDNDNILINTTKIHVGLRTD